MLAHLARDEQIRRLGRAAPRQIVRANADRSGRPARPARSREAERARRLRRRERLWPAHARDANSRRPRPRDRGIERHRGRHAHGHAHLSRRGAATADAGDEPGAGACDQVGIVELSASSPIRSRRRALLLVFVPIGMSAARYYWVGDGRSNWQTADRSSAGLLLPATSNPDALIRTYAARTVRWRSIFAVHTWIVVKEKDATSYSRYDYTAWGEPIRSNGFAPDGRWFGATPEAVVAVDGPRAEALIPKMRHVIENYRFRTYGDYSAWPGPNSNTFVQAALMPCPNFAVPTRRCDRNRRRSACSERSLPPRPGSLRPDSVPTCGSAPAA